MSHPTLRLSDGKRDTSPQLQKDVKELQTCLNRFGFKVDVDGIFGNGTEASVQQFQADHNLTADGIVGQQTWAALEAAPPSDGSDDSTDSANDFPTTFSSDNAGLSAQFAAALKFKASINASAQRIGVPSVVIVGIGSRESGWGLSTKPPGPAGTGDFGKRKFPTALRTGPLPPDGGFGRGLMQIDFDAFEFARTGNWQDPDANINEGCSVLKSNLDLLGRKTSLTGRDLLQAAVAAYNCGAGNVLKAIGENQDVDSFTAGKNYSADVLNRAGFFQSKGWENEA
jgi:peptidoglycan hydrolase-like protein with peptidoglycan-binding domain